MLASKLKEMPESQREKLIAAIEANPELFTMIAKEVESEVKGGKDQSAAPLSVMQKHGDALRQALQ